MNGQVTQVIEWVASAVELVAVGIIAAAFSYGTIRFLLHALTGVAGAYAAFKAYLGRSLLLALEFLIAADVIRTVALAPTLQNVEILALLVLVRTFLSWSVVVEIEGDWPWNLRREAGP